MKSIFIFSLLMLAATVGYSSIDSQSLEFYGAKFKENNLERSKEYELKLKAHQQVFCEKAPELVANRYGQVIFSKFSCLDGIAELRIRNDGTRFFVLTKVVSYYGGENGYLELAVVASLTEENGVDFFRRIAVLGIDE